MLNLFICYKKKIKLIWDKTQDFHSKARFVSTEGYDNKVKRCRTGSKKRERKLLTWLASCLAAFILRFVTIPFSFFPHHPPLFSSFSNLFVNNLFIS